MTGRDTPARDRGDLLADAWNHYAQEIRGVCRKWMHGRTEDANEAFSRTWSRFAVHYPGVQVDDPRAWLLTLAYRICMDMYRERVRRSEQTLETAEPALSTNRTPEREYLDKEMLAVIDRAMAQLPPRLGSAIKAYVASDADYDAVSRLLGITPVNARKRVQQARAILRRKLADYRRK